MTRETPFALTSLSPVHLNEPGQLAAIQSWRAAGLVVYSFNHPSEIEALAPRYDVSFVPVEQTSAHLFGRPYVPITAMLEWAARRGTVLILNSDIELRMSPSELHRIRRVSDAGLCYFVRYNHEGDLGCATREPWGIDAFLLHGRHAALFPGSFLSMGQPFWDYWLPLTFAARGLPVHSVEFPVTFHRGHPRQWSWDNWHRCALELDRLAGVLGADRSLEACVEMSRRVRADLDRHRLAMAQRPGAIRDWVERRFATPGPKCFLELGAHCGSDTDWMARLPEVTIHAFEPDPRNHPPPRPNVVMNRLAVADHDRGVPFILSSQGWGQEWTYSSSIKRPKNHLHRYPVTFGETIEVKTTTLDSYCREHDLAVIDFIWCDIQGAEGEMVRGGLEMLARTRYLYTEFSDDELYEGQATLSDLLALLPDFRVLELWDEDVLLENTRLRT